MSDAPISEIEDVVAEAFAALLELGLQARRRARHVTAIGGLVAQTGLGVEHRKHLFGVIRPVGRQRQQAAVLQTRDRQARELGLDQLAQRLGEGEVQELIVATNPTVEGEATAHYLAQLARAHKVHPSRLAHGVPLGGELEYVDRGTLSHAFGSRSEIP